jgi:quercetin dioxygenase-like cupin family protein
MKLRYVISIAAITILGVAVAQENTKSNPTHGQSIHTPDKIVWKAGPASLPPGAKMVVLEGDPTKEGPFTMRVALPDGYTIPPHTHPGIEHITVLSGTFHFGMGEKFDKSATQAMPAGTFGYWPAGMKHFAWVNGETVLQLHGIGPWGINYVNPADDPRKSK